MEQFLNSISDVRMDKMRKLLVVFNKLRSPPHSGRRLFCNVPSYSNKNAEVPFNNLPSISVSETSPVSPHDMMQNPKMVSLLEVTSKLGIRLDNLMSSLKISPELCNVSPKTWENGFKEITSYGFSKKRFMRMITMYPELFKMVENEKFGSAMTSWMNCKLGYDNMLALLAKQPQFLSVPDDKLRERIPLLKAVTKSSSDNVVRLLRGCPSLLSHDWRVVNAKLDYIEYEMKIDTKKENLSKCYALNRNLEEIKTRHKFLER